MTPPDPRDRPVLVVEDLDDDYETVADAADRAGVSLLRSTRLADARLALRQRAVSIVLLDVNLPDGPTSAFVRALRADTALRSIPVVVFSTSDAPRDVNALYAAGANAYHVKALRYSDNLDALAGIFSYWLDAARLADPPAHA